MVHIGSVYIFLIVLYLLYMLINSRGVVIKTTKYGDTSVISHILTEAKGLRSFIVNGVRTRKAAMPLVLFQPGTVLDLQMYSNDQKKLLRLKEAKPHYVWTRIAFDIKRSSLTLFISELIQKTIHETEENQLLFNEILRYLLYIDSSTNSISNIPLHFLINLSRYLGFQPQGHFDAETPCFDLFDGSFCLYPNTIHFLKADLSEQLSKLMEVELEDLHTISLSKDTRRKLLEELLHYYKLHIENFPSIRSHEVFHSIMEI